MRIERGDLVDLDERQPHLLRERHQMPRMEAVIFVLQQMQMLDEEIALPRPLAQQRLHFGERLGLDLPPLRQIPPAAPPGAGTDAARRAHGLTVDSRQSTVDKTLSD